MKRFIIRGIIQFLMMGLVYFFGYKLLIPIIGWKGAWGVFLVSWGMCLSFKSI